MKNYNLTPLGLIILSVLLLSIFSIVIDSEVDNSPTYGYYLELRDSNIVVLDTQTNDSITCVSYDSELGKKLLKDNE